MTTDGFDSAVDEDGNHPPEELTEEQRLERQDAAVNAVSEVIRVLRENTEPVVHEIPAGNYESNGTQYAVSETARDRTYEGAIQGRPATIEYFHRATGIGGGKGTPEERIDREYLKVTINEGEKKDVITIDLIADPVELVLDLANRMKLGDENPDDPFNTAISVLSDIAKSVHPIEETAEAE